MVQSEDHPYYHWTDKKPTHNGKWYRRYKTMNLEDQIFLVKGISMGKNKGELICYLDECGWRPVDEDTEGFYEWSDKPVPFPGIPRILN